MAGLTSRSFRLLHNICIQMKGHFTFTGTCSLYAPSTRAPGSVCLIFLTFVHLVHIALVLCLWRQEAPGVSDQLPPKWDGDMQKQGQVLLFGIQSLLWGLFSFGWSCLAWIPGILSSHILWQGYSTWHWSMIPPKSALPSPHCPFPQEEGFVSKDIHFTTIHCMLTVCQALL